VPHSIQECSIVIEAGAKPPLVFSHEEAFGPPVLSDDDAITKLAQNRPDGWRVA